MTSVRVEALDPTDPRSQAAINQFLNEMVELVGADVLEIDVAQEARDDSGAASSSSPLTTATTWSAAALSVRSDPRSGRSVASG